MGSSREAGSGRNGIRHLVGSIGPGQRMDGPMRAIRVRLVPAEEHGSWPEGNALSASGSGIMSRGGTERLLDCMCSTQVNSSNQGRGAARPEKGGTGLPWALLVLRAGTKPRTAVAALARAGEVGAMNHAEQESGSCVLLDVGP